MSKKSNKKALWLSALAMFACVAMLIGSTFAWFTDSVTSAGNKIQAGTLQIDLELLDKESGEFHSIKNDTTPLFNYNLWEPGYTEAVVLKLENEGSLALKWVAQFVSEYELTALADVIDVYVLKSATEIGYPTNRDLAGYDKVGTVAEFVNTIEETTNGTLEAKESVYMGIALKMQESAGNEYQGMPLCENNGGFDIKIFATQYTFEVDSFGNDYDAGAPWTGTTNIDWYLENPDASEYVLKSGDELAGLAAIVNGTAVAPATTYAAREVVTIKDNFKGKTIKLGGNIDLNNFDWTPIGDNANPFLGNFDGQGYTVSNLFVSNEGWAGLIGHAGKAAGCTVKNVTIDGATILSNRMAGAVVGQIYGSIDNCHVKNAEIIAVPNAVGDSYDNGDKVGGIVGWLGDNGNNRTLSNCTATNVQLGAYRDVGGIVGYVASSTTVKGNSVSDVTITVDQSTNYYGDKDVNAGYIYGRANGTITAENNASADSKVDSTYSKNGLTLEADGEGNVKLYLVPETYAAATVTVPEGVTAIGNYAFAYNANVETVVLASTVRDLGRGFDSSSVKKVVLNEGLEVIGSRAFRSTTALEEVVISSTVKEIADNAFQKSAIKEIIIPATVETIGETAFGASLIEKVTFEGDIEIQGYAFRGCTKLREVVMKGDVDFVASKLNGRNSCWFCNGESNNPNTSNITFTVTSEEIKEKVLTAMGAERNNTPVIVDDGFVAVESVDELKDALANATAGTKINANGLTLNPTGSLADTVSIPAGVTIKGANFASGSQCYLVTTGSGDDVVFEDCTFDGPGFGMFVIAGNDQDGAAMVFENCTFKGQVAPNFVQNSNGSSTFNNCTFTLGSDGIGLVNCMGGTHTFNQCTFDYTGGATFGSNQYVKWNAVNSYSENFSTKVILNGCTFKNCGTQRFGGNSTLTIK